MFNADDDDSDVDNDDDMSIFTSLGYFCHVSYEYFVSVNGKCCFAHPKLPPSLITPCRHPTILLSLIIISDKLSVGVNIWGGGY